jgi:hypothetical protein
MELRIRLSFVKTSECRGGRGLNPTKPPLSVRHTIALKRVVVVYAVWGSPFLICVLEAYFQILLYKNVK